MWFNRKAKDYPQQLDSLTKQVADNYYHQLYQQLLHEINGRLSHMSASLDRLTQQVADNKASIDAAIALVGTLASATPADDSAALDALTADLAAQKQSLDASVAAHTPAPVV